MRGSIFTSVGTAFANSPKKVQIDGGILIESRVLIPLRTVFTELDANVNWDSASKVITIKSADTTITLKVNQKVATVNNSNLQLDTAPIIRNGTTYIPLRFVSETLGAKVEWNQASSTVTVTNDTKQLIVSVSNHTSQQQNTTNTPFSYTTKTFNVNGKKISTNIVTIDMQNPRVGLKIGLAHNSVGSVENLSSIASRHNAKVAINGSFFDAYTSSPTKKPYGYVMVNGQLLNNGDKRAVFAFDQNNKPYILSGDDFIANQDRYVGAIQAGPTLVKNGQVWVNLAMEGHNDPKILTNSGARSAIGITKNNKIILVTTNGALIKDLASVMVQLGADYAMNLDGGASSGLYYNGKNITTPGRQISNAIIFSY